MADPLARQDSRSRQSRFLMPPRPLRVRPTGSGASLTPHLRVALLEPDIPQNTGTILRLAACLGVEAHIIEPAGFPTTDRAFRRAGMDYLDQVDIVRHQSWKAFETWRSTASARLILFTTHAAVILSRPRISARRRPAVRPGIVRRGREGARGRRREAGHSDADRPALAQRGDGSGNGGGRSNAADRVVRRGSGHARRCPESTRRVRDSTRPKALPLTRIARLALVVTRRLPSPHASGGSTSHSPIPHMHNVSRNNGKKKLSCNFLPSKHLVRIAIMPAMVLACPQVTAARPCPKGRTAGGFDEQ